MHHILRLLLRNWVVQPGMFVFVSLVPSDSYAVGILGIVGTMGIRLCIIRVDNIASVILPGSLIMIAPIIPIT